MSINVKPVRLEMPLFGDKNDNECTRAYTLSNGRVVIYGDNGNKVIRIWDVGGFGGKYQTILNEINNRRGSITTDNLIETLDGCLLYSCDFPRNSSLKKINLRDSSKNIIIGELDTIIKIGEFSNGDILICTYISRDKLIKYIKYDKNLNKILNEHIRKEIWNTSMMKIVDDKVYSSERSRENFETFIYDSDLNIVDKISEIYDVCSFKNTILYLRRNNLAILQDKYTKKTLKLNITHPRKIIVLQDDRLLIINDDNDIYLLDYKTEDYMLINRMGFSIRSDGIHVPTQLKDGRILEVDLYHMYIWDLPVKTDESIFKGRILEKLY